MEKVNHYPFGFPLTVFEAAITRDDEAYNLFEKVVSLSKSINAGKGLIVDTKRILNKAVVAVEHYKLLSAFNLPIPADNLVARYGLDDARTFINEHTEKLHTRQKDLKKIYIAHDKTVKELKNAIDKFARTCAIRHTRQTQINSEEQSLTTLNLSRVGVLTLIKKLSDEIKAKPTCNNFTVTINSGVTKS